MKSITDHRIVLIVSVCVILLTATGIVSGAVTGEFESQYDSYGGESSTDVPGNEIQTSGTLQFTGEDSVDVRIDIRSAQHTLLDRRSVTLLQPGDTSISFDKINTERGVRYTADEVPAGTDLEVEYVVYPVSGLDRDEIESSTVSVSFERPGGNRDSEVISVNTELDRTHEDAIDELRQEAGVEGNPSWGELGLVWQVMTALGGLLLLAVLVSLVLWLTSGNDDTVDI